MGRGTGSILMVAMMLVLPRSAAPRQASTGQQPPGKNAQPHPLRKVQVPANARFRLTLMGNGTMYGAEMQFATYRTPEGAGVSVWSPREVDGDRARSLFDRSLAEAGEVLNRLTQKDSNGKTLSDWACVTFGSVVPPGVVAPPSDGFSILQMRGLHFRSTESGSLRVLLEFTTDGTPTFKKFAAGCRASYDWLTKWSEPLF